MNRDNQQEQAKLKLLSQEIEALVPLIWRPNHGALFAALELITPASDARTAARALINHAHMPVFTMLPEKLTTWWVNNLCFDAETNRQSRLYELCFGLKPTTVFPSCQQIVLQKFEQILRAELAEDRANSKNSIAQQFTPAKWWENDLIPAAVTLIQKALKEEEVQRPSVQGQTETLCNETPVLPSPAEAFSIIANAPLLERPTHLRTLQAEAERNVRFSPFEALLWVSDLHSFITAPPRPELVEQSRIGVYAAFKRAQSAGHSADSLREAINMRIYADAFLRHKLSSFS